VTAAVRLEAIERTYPGTRALDGVTLELFPSEIVGLVGKNGAGKSTLMRILAGIERADAGRIIIDGTDVSAGYSPGQANKRGIAMVHQELELLPSMSVAENICLGTKLPRRAGRLVDHNLMESQAQQILSVLKPGLNVHDLVDTLGPADRRMVMIARALRRNARVIVLDEPSASLNTEEVGHLHDVVRRLAADGCSVVYVTHRLDEVLQLTSRTVTMRDGSAVDDRPTRDHSSSSLIAGITGAAKPEPVSRRAGPERRQPMLEVRHLADGNKVVDVSLTLDAGEIVGLAGLAGSGRTEVARLIAGADRPLVGEVLVDGSPVPRGRTRAAVKAGIALVPEERRNQGLVTDFGTSANISLATLARKSRFGVWVSRRLERECASRLVDLLQIKIADLDRPVSVLSGGNQQKVVIGKWLERDPKVLIFDEPTQGIDVGSKREVMKIARQAADGGAAVLLITSDFSEFAADCSRVIVLRDGRIRAEVTGDQISESTLVDLCFSA
jgi:ABC-type sugar transport system ATPase subunit